MKKKFKYLVSSFPVLVSCVLYRQNMLSPLYLRARVLQGEHKVFPLLQTFIKRKPRGTPQLEEFQP